MDRAEIKKNISDVLRELPENVDLVAAAKTRTKEEIDAAVEAGVTIIGENYIQETEAVYDTYSGRVRWHLIGHLQRNKVKKAVELFDMIETVDSYRLALAVSESAKAAGKVMPGLIEINIARETAKYGIAPENVRKFAEDISSLPNLSIQGLMTMGPNVEHAESLREYFAEARQIFDDLKLRPVENVEMRYLSMGMSDSYRVAVEEGANIVRIGSILFGQRKGH